MKKLASVNWVHAGLAANAWPIAGSAGRYMSIASGAKAVSAPRMMINSVRFWRMACLNGLGRGIKKRPDRSIRPPQARDVADPAGFGQSDRSADRSSREV